MRAPLGNLLGVWAVQGKITSKQYAASQKYAQIVDKMRWLIDITGHRDTLRRYLPQGMPPDVTEEQARSIRSEYQAWFEVIRLNRAERALKLAMEDNPNTDLERVKIGLQACYERFM
jgi:hypothetical protein